MQQSDRLQSLQKNKTPEPLKFRRFGAPLGIRTPDLRIRSALLYPAELMALIELAETIIQ